MDNNDICADVVNKMIDSDEIVLSIQNLEELSRVLSEKSFPSLDKELIRQYVFDFSETVITIAYNAHTIMDALSISKQYDLHFFDALLAATMQENGVDTIITENITDFSKIPWLKVINPFGK